MGIECGRVGSGVVVGRSWCCGLGLGYGGVGCGNAWVRGCGIGMVPGGIM